MEPNLIRTILEAVGAMVLLPLTVMALKWLRVRLKLDRTMTDEAIESAATRIVDGAIGATEQFARNHIKAIGESPGGPAKKEHAMRLASIGMDEAKIKRSEDQMSRLIEARLGHPDAPGGVVQPIAHFSLAPPPVPAGSISPTIGEIIDPSMEEE